MFQNIVLEYVAGIRKRKYWVSLYSEMQIYTVTWIFKNS